SAGVGLEPQAGYFLDTIQTIRATITPDTLLAAARMSAQDARDKSTDAAGDDEARSKLARLRLELAAYCYYCATLMQFFNADLTEKRLKAAEDGSGDRSINQLAQARQAFAISPQVTCSMTSAFRRAHGMDVPIFEGKPGQAAALTTPAGAEKAAAISVPAAKSD
ncbi:MAG TPA: hypothetical protein VFD73_18575, partial [Gemmatimonadales bacterium]|nr:hypothetical protein [Gemmatimonadales bacterium]